MAKTLAWVNDVPLVPVNHLEGHIYAAWLLDPDEADKPAPEFPLVALVVSGGHTFLVEMTDHLTLPVTRPDGRRRSRRSLRQGRPAARAAVSGRPRHPAAPRRRESRDRRFPRAWLGDTFDFSFSGLKTAARREVARELGTDPKSVRPTATAAARSVGRRAGLRLPGFGGRRAGLQDDASRREGRCAHDHPRRRSGRQLGPARTGAPTARERWASGWSCRGPGCAPTTLR